MTSANVSDEPIAYCDDDALERLRDDRRPVPRPRPADPDADRRLGRARRSTLPDRRGRLFLRRSRGYVPASLPLPGAGTPRPLLACGAELKNTFCMARGRSRVGQPPHRRPRELRDASLVRRGDRALRSAVRGRARGRRPRPPPRVPVDEIRARARRRRADRGPAPPRAPGRVPRRAWRARARARRDLRRHRVRARRHRLGRRAAARRPALVPPSRVAAAGRAARRRARDQAAVADGVLMAVGLA